MPAAVSTPFSLTSRRKSAAASAYDAADDRSS
jgi:hypothetical protein